MDPYFGQDIQRIVDRLLHEQLADGGWNCEAENGSTRSSFNTTICVLEALLEYEVLDAEQLRQIITDCGALAAVEELITELTSAATTALEHAPVKDDDVTTALRDLAAVATHRDW